MDDNESLDHSRWECIYHVAFTLKCRRRTLYKALRQPLGKVLKGLRARKREFHVHVSGRRPAGGVFFLISFSGGNVVLGAYCAFQLMMFDEGWRELQSRHLNGLGEV